MRPGQQNKRGRGRNNNNSGNNNRKGQNPLSRTYDSSGPDVKIRGTAQTVADKYMNLARDSQSSGDRVMAENYLQHAEHYNRIIAAAQAQVQERFQRDERDNQSRDDQSRDDQSDDDQSDNNNNSNDMSSDQNSDRYDSDDNDSDSYDGNRGNRDHNNGNGNGGNNGNNSNSGNRRNRPRSERPSVDPDSPQPVIEGVPAEVALEQDSSGDEGAAKPVRRARRPRRAKASEGGDEAAPKKAGKSSDDKPGAEADSQPKAETAPAE